MSDSPLMVRIQAQRLCADYADAANKKQGDIPRAPHTATSDPWEPARAFERGRVMAANELHGKIGKLAAESSAGTTAPTHFYPQGFAATLRKLMERSGEASQIAVDRSTLAGIVAMIEETGPASASSGEPDTRKEVIEACAKLCDKVAHETTVEAWIGAAEKCAYKLRALVSIDAARSASERGQ